MRGEACVGPPSGGPGMHAIAVSLTLPEGWGSEGVCEATVTWTVCVRDSDTAWASGVALTQMRHRAEGLQRASYIFIYMHIYTRIYVYIRL
jgi:hypothetical protein